MRKTIRQMTPLMLAVASETQDAKAVELLIQAGARVNEASAIGETALDWANKFGNPLVIATLTESRSEVRHSPHSAGSIAAGKAS
jgi:ankyrin repeat protein